MKRLIIPFILFFILVFEGVAPEFLPAHFKSSEIFIVSHWVLIFLILVSLFLDTNDSFIAIFYGIIFGLLTDVVYTGILGVYMFAYPFSLYIAHLLKRFLQTNFFMTIIITSVCIFVTEMLLFLIYSFVGLTEETINSFFIYRFFTTLIANLLFLIFIYHVTKKLLKWIRMNK